MWSKVIGKAVEVVSQEVLEPVVGKRKAKFASAALGIGATLITAKLTLDAAGGTQGVKDAIEFAMLWDGPLNHPETFQQFENR